MHNFERSSLWIATLAPRSDDEFESERDLLRQSFFAFRENVRRVADEIPRHMPEFTDHSIEHIDALWETASLIVGDSTKVNPLEAFVLGGSFLLHDLGMGLSAYKNLGADLYGTVEFADTLNIVRRGNKELDEDEARQVALTIVLRNNHAAQAERLVNQQFSYGLDTTTYLLENAMLRAHYGATIGKIAHSHWFDVESLHQNFPQVLGSSNVLPAVWTCDPLKLACILRLADASQIDSRRAPSLTHGLRSLNHVSARHWLFQSLLLNPTATNDRLVYTSTRAFLTSEFQAWWLAFDTIRMINSEFRQVDALLADLGKPSLKIRSVAGADNPKRFANYVQTDGWVPIDASIRASNVSNLVKNLGGKELYGPDKVVALRELIANAADATRARAATYDQNDTGIWIAVDHHEDDTWHITIRDRGIGMDATSLVNNLTDFGTSSWLNVSSATEQPGLASTHFEPTGKFGIGFFSVFMLGNEVVVRSLPYRGGSSATQVLEFSSGSGERPILRQAVPDEYLDFGGTEISVKLLNAPRTLDGILGDGPSLQSIDEALRSKLKQLCALIDFDLYYKGSDQSAYSLIVAGNSWKTSSNRDLFNTLYEEKFNDGDPLVREMFAAYRDAFDVHASTIYDENGILIGRAMLAAGFDQMLSMDMWWWPSGHAGVYVGGMYADAIYSLLGAFVGDPTKADRNSAFPRATPEILQKWATQQGRERFKEKYGRPSSRYEAGQLVLAMNGEADQLPCAYHADGLLNPSELEDWIAERDEIFVVGDFEVHFFSNDEGDVEFIDRTKGMRLVWPPDVLVCSLYPSWIFPDDIYRRPTNDRFSDAAPDKRIRWDPRHYWYRTGSIGTMRLILEAASRAWDTDSRQVGLNSQMLVYDLDSHDRRLEVPVYGKPGTNVKIDSLRLSRRAHDRN